MPTSPFIDAFLSDLDRTNLLVYADWLEENGDELGIPLRLYVMTPSHETLMGLVPHFKQCMYLEPCWLFTPQPPNPNDTRYVYAYLPEKVWVEIRLRWRRGWSLWDTINSRAIIPLHIQGFHPPLSILGSHTFRKTLPTEQILHLTWTELAPIVPSLSKKQPQTFYSADKFPLELLRLYLP